MERKRQTTLKSFFVKKAKQDSQSDTVDNTHLREGIPTKKSNDNTVFLPEVSTNNTDENYIFDHHHDHNASVHADESPENAIESTTVNNVAGPSSEPSGPCGVLSDKPNQPRNLKFSKRQFGNQKRAFNPLWFEQFKFLHYREANDTVLCHTCAVAHTRGMLKVTPKKDDVFIKKGFSNWKKAIEKFQAHAASTTHCHATEVLMKPVHVDEQLNHAAAIQKAENSRCFMKILENICFLGRQGLALRGDGDDKGGNFYQLAILRSKDDPALQRWISRSYDRHMSPQAQNEILKLLALKIMRSIATDIAVSECYSVLADEAVDVSNTQQLVVCIRWVTKDLQIAEDFVALHPLEQANAKTIASAIKDVILRLALPLDQARGQCYDGCSTMTGSKNGVATILKKSAPHCLLTHCYCHALNLAVGDTVKSVPVMKETLEDAYELTKLIKYSPKREAALKKKQEELKIRNLDLPLDTGETNTKLKLLCPTRWTVRAKALHSIASNYQAIQDMLEWCEDSKNTSDSEIRARAGGVAKKMDRFHFLYGLHLSMLVLDHSDNLSATLQSPQLCAAGAQETARLVVRTLRSIRTDEHAQHFYDKVTQEAHRLHLCESEPRLPRRTRRPIRFDQGSEPYHSQSPEEYYRHQYFAAIDTVMSTIEDRFDQPDYQVYMNLEQTLIKGAVGQCCEEHIKVLEDHYRTLDFIQLRAQLESFAVSYKETSDFKQQPCLSDVVNHLRSLSDGQRNLMSQVVQVARFCLVMPASNAVSERAFSTMRRIKSYLRSTMTHNRLNHTMCLSVHSDRLDNLNLKSVLNEFVNSSERRKIMFAFV